MPTAVGRQNGAIGTNARLDVWMGMHHGFVVSIGTVKASEQALDAIGKFLTERLRAGIRDPLSRV